MILALDTSATRTGWCAGEPDGLTRTGSAGFGGYGCDIGGLLLAFERWLIGMVEETSPSRIVFEKPVRPFSTLNLETARKLYGLTGIVELVASRENIPVREVSNTEAKKLCYGNGGLKSAEAKKVAVERAEAWGFRPSNHDEADACAVWLVAVKHHYPEAFAYREALRSGRRAEAGETLL